MPIIAYGSLRQEAEYYWRWAQVQSIPKLPQAVAKEGAGSELRTKFMHVGSVMPIYLAVIRYLSSRSDQKGTKLLELGSGSGRPLAYLQTLFPAIAVYGVDYSKACVDYATAHYAKFGVKFKHMKPPRTPYRDETFDYVISSHVIEHVKKVQGKAFLLETRRLLKRGGVAFIGTPNRERCQNVYMDNPTDNPKYRLVPPHEHEYTYEELYKLAESVFGKGKVQIDSIDNPKFARVFSESIAIFRPDGSSKQQVKQSLYRLSTKFLPRPIFDQIAQIGTKRVMRKLHLDYDDILYANEILPESKKTPADNFLLICKR